MAKLWMFYLLGAIGTLAWKYWLYIRTARKAGITVKAASGDWFFEKSAENAFSWLATIGIVWCIGVAYIDRVDLLLTGWLGKVPLHPAFALLLGSINEYVSPNVIKWIVGKFGGGQ